MCVCVCSYTICTTKLNYLTYFCGNILLAKFEVLDLTD